MATVFDVAAYILSKHGRTTTMKLQKLVYYAQAWSLVWDDKPLFQEEIEAWANGPVCPALYDTHRGQFEIGPKDINGDPSVFSETEIETMDQVIAYYGDKSSHWLSQLTHAEEPWKQARAGLAPGDRGHTVITHAAMAEYYDSLD